MAERAEVPIELARELWRQLGFAPTTDDPATAAEVALALQGD